ncbi:VOC family protein [Pseudonocardia xishanensis]|uniref:VOC domain-containing protein n=1 Tax=Pseudonocardia xishanensis TaxID=630995 RepID=A0ABP8RPT4_9PSEU
MSELRRSAWSGERPTTEQVTTKGRRFVGQERILLMAISNVLAQATVSDLDAAEQWYSVLFGRAPDARPMDGLLEWRLGSSFGVQVFAEPDRAGRSSMVLGEDDLDGLAARLADAGVDHDGPQQVTASRILALQDSDGNRVVFTGP